MADEGRIAQLEAQVRLLKKLSIAISLLLIAGISIGAATVIKDQAVHGKLSILAEDGTPKTILYPDGHVAIGEKLTVKNRDIIAEFDKLRDTVSSFKIKDIKIFIQDVHINTTKKEDKTILRFPERVDHVSIESLLNDGHDMHVMRADRRDEKSFDITFVGTRPEGVQWIPSVRFLGFQLIR